MYRFILGLSMDSLEQNCFEKKRIFYDFKVHIEKVWYDCFKDSHPKHATTKQVTTKPSIMDTWLYMQLCCCSYNKNLPFSNTLDVRRKILILMLYMRHIMLIKFSKLGLKDIKICF